MVSSSDRTSQASDVDTDAFLWANCSVGRSAKAVTGSLLVRYSENVSLLIELCNYKLNFKKHVSYISESCLYHIAYKMARWTTVFIGSLDPGTSHNIFKSAIGY